MKQFLQDSQAALSDKMHRASTEKESIETISFVNISQMIKAEQIPALMLHSRNIQRSGAVVVIPFLPTVNLAALRQHSAR
eukprot:3801-Heterococcus_DN1.PRE.2